MRPADGPVGCHNDALCTLVRAITDTSCDDSSLLGGADLKQDSTFISVLMPEAEAPRR